MNKVNSMSEKEIKHTSHKILPPPPVFFIKSISEQGYSLSTAVADLIDNSITAGAKRIELLINTNVLPLRLFIADDGCGMTAEEITSNMRFPSADLEVQRTENDLGRFGLGLKTGSFSQARKFTLVSSKPDTPYEACTWDVEYLKKTQDWTLIIENFAAIRNLLNDYESLSSDFHSRNVEFVPRTLIVWDNLYKLERLKKKSEINDELEELRSHLGLVFHRFLQSGKLEIRLNNAMIDAFDPFPVNVAGVQLIAENYWQSTDTFIRFQGIILPKRAATEVKDGSSVWAPAGRSLEESQGIFIYRNERLISYGGWLRTISKSVSLQFGRIKIDITSANDSEFQLNVAKSSLKLPFGMKRAMAEMIVSVARQAAKEFHERLASGIIRNNTAKSGLSLITKDSNAAGPVLRINHNFELIRELECSLNASQLELLKTITSILEKKINQIWKGDSTSTSEIYSDLCAEDKERIIRLRKYYITSGYSPEEIREFLSDSFSCNNDTKNFIDSLT